tara:strand:+ start:1418 stop:1717 length:300 start_codon:yes stop_codon:yes gene_type:complete
MLIKDEINKWEKQKDSLWEDMDNVNHPPHYNSGNIETIDYIVDVLGKYEAISYCQGNVIKYTGSRLFNKGKPIEDAKKARWYLDKMIQLLEETKGINWS